MRENYTKIFESELKTLHGVFEKEVMFENVQLDEGVMDWIKKAVKAPGKVKNWIVKNPKKSAVIASIGAFITYAIANPDAAAEALSNITDAIGLGGDNADVISNVADVSNPLEVLKGEEFKNIIDTLNDAYQSDPSLVDTPEEVHNALNKFMTGVVKVPGVTEEIAQKAADTIKVFQSLDDEVVSKSFEMMKQGVKMAADTSDMVSQAKSVMEEHYLFEEDFSEEEITLEGEVHGALYHRSTRKPITFR